MLTTQFKEIKINPALPATVKRTGRAVEQEDMQSLCMASKQTPFSAEYIRCFYRLIHSVNAIGVGKHFQSANSG